MCLRIKWRGILAAIFACLIFSVRAHAQSVEELERTRNQWQKPSEVLSELGVKEGWAVADIGAGGGYFTFILSKRVGPAGRVWAVDTNPATVAWLKVKAHQFRAKNVTVVQSVPDNPSLPAPGLDLVLIVETFHEFAHPVEMLHELWLAMKPRGALLCIIDTPRSDGNPNHAITKDTVIRVLEENSFVLDREPGFLSRQFMLIFKKRD